MSTPRTRPTREETRRAVVQAAARVFSEKGIGASSIEDICDEAGFSRGAFYSSFSNKDELVIELVEQHYDLSISESERLFAEADDAESFFRSLESEEREYPVDGVGNNPVLFMELFLYVLRDPANRPRLLRHDQALQRSIGAMVEALALGEAGELPMPVEDMVSLIRALDLGFGLLAVVDPSSHRDSRFADTLTVLHRLTGGEGTIERPERSE